MDISQVVSKAVSILLKDTKTTEKMCIEAYIYALQYIRYCTNADNQAYAYAVEYVYKMLPKVCAMSFNSFGDYFEERCQWYEELHCKIAKAKQEGNNMPIAWSIIQHLIFTFPLQNVDKKDVGQYAFTHTDLFENMDFIQNSLSMFSFIYRCFEDNKQEDTNEVEGIFEGFDKDEFDSYDDEEGPVKVAELLLKHHTKEQAIDIVIDGLERDLNEYKQNQMSEKARNFVDKACRILDILQPLNMPTWYSHCKSQEELAEFLTIDYNRINDTIDILKKLSQQTKLRAQGMMVVTTGPAMTIQANKLLEQSKLYDSMSLFFLEWKRQLGIASLERKIWRDLIPGEPLSSKSYLIDGFVLGWIFNGKVYVNKEFPINANKAYLHLYTYLWIEHCLATNHILYQVIRNLATSTNYYHHIRCSEKFLDLSEDQAAIKAFCYLVAFDGVDIFLDDKRKEQLMSSELVGYKTFDLPRMVDLTIDEAKRLPLISFIRGDKISDKDIYGEIKFYNSKQ